MATVREQELAAAEQERASDQARKAAILKVPPLRVFLASLRKPFEIVFDSLKRRQLKKELVAKVRKMRPDQGLCIPYRDDHPQYAWFALVFEEIRRENKDLTVTKWGGNKLMLCRTAGADMLSRMDPRGMSVNEAAGYVERGES